jgi:hypothetical protein
VFSRISKLWFLVTGLSAFSVRRQLQLFTKMFLALLQIQHHGKRRERIGVLSGVRIFGF